MSQSDLSGFNRPFATADAPVLVTSDAAIRPSLTDSRSTFPGTKVSIAHSSPMTSNDVAAPEVPVVTRPTESFKMLTTRVQVTHTITKTAATDVTGMALDLYQPLAQTPSSMPHPPTYTSHMQPHSDSSTSSSTKNGAIVGGIVGAIAGITILVWFISRHCRRRPASDVEQGKLRHCSTHQANTNDVLDEVQARRNRRNRRNCAQPAPALAEDIDLTDLANAQGWEKNFDINRFQSTRYDANNYRISRDKPASQGSSVGTNPSEMAVAHAWDTPFGADNFQSART